MSLLLALAILLVAPRKATSVEPIPGTCTIDTAWRNTDRYVQGPVYAECYGDPINCWPFAGHTVPWGNWGVNSNAGNKNDTHQFWGHEYIDGNYQWNSCTEDAQSSNQGAQRYAFYRGQAAWVPCSEAGLGGTVWTFTNQYMEMWELDGCDEDEYVATAEYGTVDVVLQCSGGTCYSESAWHDPTSVSPNVLTAKIQVQMWAF